MKLTSSPEHLTEDFPSIPAFKAWREITPIEKGWSNDRKYQVNDKYGQQFLLRTSPSGDHQRKLEEFRITTEFSRTGITMPRPIEIGLFDGRKRSYTLLSWVVGTETEEYLRGTPETEQYRLGFLAGKSHRTLHGLVPSDTVETWEARYNRKIESKLAKYKDCPVPIPGGEIMVAFIQDTRVALKNRPQSYQHGDFHVGNLLITPDSNIGIIDFNRLDYGDPWEEFNRIVFCAGLSQPFARGRIDGYFGGSIPEEFFRLMALYITVNAISAVSWSLAYGEKEVQTMLKQAEMILKMYQNFTNLVPQWYRE